MTVSTAFRDSAYKQEATDVVIPLLTIEHASLANPIRVAFNNENIISNGNTFVGTFFNITLPIDEAEAGPHASIEIDNVSQEIVRAVRSINTPASVTIQVVRTTAPDVIEVSYAGMDMVNVSYDVQKVSGELTFESFLEEPYPYARFDPARFPGAF